MPNLSDFAPRRRQPVNYDDLLTLAMAPNILSRLPRVNIGLSQEPPADAMQEGFFGGLNRLDLLKRLFAGLNAPAAARNPAIEPAYQAYRAGERAG